ncbi:MAG: glycosyltransferase, partial [Proteobacteria bacterium]|nr:glycosyltransferase [Pseudomonadota bacterium]
PLVVATITRLAPGKGVEIFVKAVSEIAHQLPNARFWIVGGGPSRERIEADIQALGLQERIELLGLRSDVPSLLAEVDVVVRMIDRAAIYREGIPRTLIESMAAGKAVIGPDLGSVPEIVAHERTGLIVPPDDAEALGKAILRLCTDSVLRRRLAENAAEAGGERFDYRTMVRDIESEYTRLARGKGLIAD